VFSVVNGFERSEMNMQPYSNAARQTSTAAPGDSATQVSTTFIGGDDGEENGPVVARSSHTGLVFADTLHELANAVTAVLINAQVLDWKLPPYSRLKRPVREIERHAQRGGALLKRLLRQFEAIGESGSESGWQVPSGHGTRFGNMAAVTGPPANATGPANLPSPVALPPAPGPSFPPRGALTSSCDPCTSAYFPKEES